MEIPFRTNNSIIPTSTIETCFHITGYKEELLLEEDKKLLQYILFF